MKKFLPILIVLVSIGKVYAQTSQLLVAEHFAGYTNGNLNTVFSGQGGTYRWTASSFYSVDYAQVSQTTPLTYSGYPSGGQYVNLTSKADYSSGFGPFSTPQYPDDPTKDFSGGTSVSLGTAATFYMSFLVRVPNQSGVTSTNNATQTLALQTSNGDHVADFFIGKNSTNNLKFGIGKSDGTTTNYTSGTYTYNATHLIIIRFDIVTGSNNDKLYMWVDPVTFSSEPTTASATVPITSGSDGYSTNFGNAVSSLELFQDDNSATASFDAIKVAYAKNFSTVAATSAAAWQQLSPTAAPLPVKFGDIKGYAKDKGAEIEWNVYSEINVAKYEVERSSDGVSFSAIGSLTAKNEEGELFYEFYDATPSSGNNYYRIRNVDIDGKSSYSSIIRVSLGSSLSAGISVYPNPVSGNHISLQATDLQKGDYSIEIFNTSGQQVYRKQFTHAGGTINQSLALPSTLQRGIYNIRVSGNGFKQAKSFLVQ